MTYNIDPAKFIVRSEGVAPDQNYPGFCCSVLKDLLNQEINSANDLMDSIAVHLRKDSPKKHVIIGNNYKDYGEYLNPRGDIDFMRGISEFGDLTTAVIELLKERGHDLTKPIAINIEYQWNEGDRIIYIPLTEIQYVPGREVHEKWAEKLYQSILGCSAREPRVVIAHSIIFNPDTAAEHKRFDDEHRWSAISHFFNQALNPETMKEDKINSLIEYYWLQSQDCALHRGSATAARIALEYLAHRTEYKVPYTKAGVNLNLQALIRPLEEFKAGWHNGKFFDFEVTQAQILAWQQKHGTPQGARSPV